MRLRPECPWEHGGKESFLKYQSNTDIFFLILLLLPSKLSNDHLTNKKFVNDFEDKIWFSKIELLHLLPAVLFDCVEEDWSLSSRLRTQREMVLMVQHQSAFFHSLEWSVIQQFLSFVVLLLPLIWLQWLSHSIVFVLQVDLQELLCCCNLNRPHIYLFHKIFWPKTKNCLDPQTRFWFQFHVYRTCNWSWLLIQVQSSFPWIHPFGCDDSSSRWRVFSRQATERNCLKSPVSFVMKYCPTSTTCTNPVSIQNLLTLLSCESDLIRSSYCCHRIW